MVVGADRIHALVELLQGMRSIRTQFFNMSKHLIIIPCGQSKVWDKHPKRGATQAKDVYTGSPFVMNRRYAEKFAHRWVILSAKYGFINPNYSIAEPYNVTFKNKSTGPVSVEKLRKQIKKMRLNSYSTIVGLGGVDYRRQITGAFDELADDLVFPFAGLAIGKGMRAIKQAIERGQSVNCDRDAWLIKTRKAVLKAIEQFDDMGRGEFLSHYGFKPASQYMLTHKGRRYDSKAIVGVAHGFNSRGARPLLSKEFSGGAATVQKALRRLGFETAKSNRQSRNRGNNMPTVDVNNIEDVCTAVHRLVRKLPRHKFPFDEQQIPQNGIYVLFEKGETGHRGNRIVRIGTHTGQNQLRSRLRQHFIQENKDRSIFRKNIGGCLLNKTKDSFLADWDLDLTSRANRNRYESQIDFNKQKRIEQRVTKYMQETLEFAVFEVPDKEQRLLLEARLISAVSRCGNCRPSKNWLGCNSPVHKVKESGLWQVMELYKNSFSGKEFRQLARRI
jgi:hypothetical protein